MTQLGHLLWLARRLRASESSALGEASSAGQRNRRPIGPALTGGSLGGGGVWWRGEDLNLRPSVCPVVASSHVTLDVPVTIEALLGEDHDWRLAAADRTCSSIIR